MAELVFNIPDVTLTAQFTIAFRRMSGSIFYGDMTSATPASTTRTVHIEGIPDGENVKRAMLTATVNPVGTQAYSSMNIQVNSLNFYTGVRKMDTAEFSNGIDWDARFYFYIDNTTGMLTSPAYSSNVIYESTLYLTDIKLTLTTGTGSAFDGLISSLPEGSKILVDEPDGVQGTYSIVHHGYGNDSLCLLWRDNCVASSIAFNHNQDTFLADNYGQLDKFLNQTFYDALPDTTKPYIQPAIYPTLDKRLYGTVLELERYVCTPSVRELKETTGSAEWHGIPLDYLDTVNCGQVYWTRSVYTSNAGYAYRIGDTGNSFTYSRDYSGGVRPCFCVLEDQIVAPSADGTYYTFASKVDAPANIYLNGAAADLDSQQRDVSAVLSWDAVVSPIVTGYEVWGCGTIDGEYSFLSAVSAGDGGAIPTELPVSSGSRGFVTTYYKVKAVTTPDTDFLDSELSNDERMVSTKRTNVHYFDGTRWLLAMPNHYNNGWTQTEGMKYYDGTQWIVPGQ
jgi:hypothetical protein